MPRGRKKSKKLPNTLLNNGQCSESPTHLAPSPVDQLTGIVLPIIVAPDDFVGPESHWHHANFSEKRPELQNLGGKAVRYSRLEFLPIHLHHDSYWGSLHNVLREPETLESNQDGQIKVAALSIAGVIPRDAIDLKTEDPSQPRRMTDKEFDFISRPQITNVEGAFRRNENYRRYSIGIFILDYALQHHFLENAITHRQRLEFLNARAQDRIKETGNLIIKRAVREALVPVADIYKSAKREGMVRGRRPDFHSSVNKVLPEHIFGSYYSRIDCLLADNAELELAA